jgi:hypothetical protein
LSLGGGLGLLHFLGYKMKNKMKRESYMMGNKVERKPMMKGRMAYKYGGDVKMDGCQPVYNGTPKAKAN